MCRQKYEKNPFNSKSLAVNIQQTKINLKLMENMNFYIFVLSKFLFLFRTPLPTIPANINNYVFISCDYIY